MEGRLTYIDWLKTSGMFLIIWGHFFPPHLSKYIYAVNVPIFLFVSGYLRKSDRDWHQWWCRQWRSLILPYIAFCLINIAISLIVNGIDCPKDIGYRVCLCMLGFHSRNGLYACGTLWFVYALLIIRFIDKLTPERFKIAVALIMLVVGFILGKRSFHCVDYWSVQAVPVCYPIFALGTLARKADIVSLVKSGSVRISVFLISVAVFYFSVRGNGGAGLVNAEYGRSPVRFILGVISGISAIGVVCLSLNETFADIVAVISNGTFLTMALHVWMIDLCKRFFWLAIPNDQVKYIVFSLAILFSFIPLILLACKYFPWLIGKRDKQTGML